MVRATAALGLLCLAGAAAGAQGASNFTQLNKLLGALELEVEVGEISADLRLGTVTVINPLRCTSFAVESVLINGSLVSNEEYDLALEVNELHFKCTVGTRYDYFLLNSRRSVSGQLSLEAKGPGVSIRPRIVASSPDFSSAGPTSAASSTSDGSQTCEELVSLDGVSLEGSNVIVVLQADLTPLIINLVEGQLKATVRDAMCEAINNVTGTLAELIVDNPVNNAVQRGAVDIVALAELAERELNLDPEIALIDWKEVANQTAAMQDKLETAVREVRDIVAGLRESSLVSLLAALSNATDGIAQLPGLGAIDLALLPELNLSSVAGLSQLPAADLLLAAGVEVPEWVDLAGVTVGDLFELAETIFGGGANSTSAALEAFELIDVGELLGFVNGTAELDKLLASVALWARDADLPFNLTIPDGFAIPDSVEAWLDFFQGLNVTNPFSDFGNLTGVPGLGGSANSTLTLPRELIGFLEELLGLDLGFLDGSSPADIVGLATTLLGQALRLEIPLGNDAMVGLQLVDVSLSGSPDLAKLWQLGTAGSHTLLLPTVDFGNVGITVELAVKATVFVNATAGRPPVQLDFLERLAIVLAWDSFASQAGLLLGYHRGAVANLATDQPDFLTCALYSIYANVTAAFLEAENARFELVGLQDGLVVLAASLVNEIFPMYAGVFPSAADALFSSLLTSIETSPSGICSATLNPTSSSPSASPTSSPSEVSTQPGGDDDGPAGAARAEESGVPVGAIAGGAAGGVLVLAAAAILVLRSRILGGGALGKESDNPVFATEAAKGSDLSEVPAAVAVDVDAKI